MNVPSRWNAFWFGWVFSWEWPDLLEYCAYTISVTGLKENQHAMIFVHRRGLWVDAFWQRHCTFRFKKPPRFTVEDEFASDPWYRFMEITWPLHQIVFAIIFYFIGGISWVVWGIAVRVAVGVTSHWVVTYFAHNPGPGRWLVKDAAVQASNLEKWSFLTHGECWHNNHHAFPESARMGIEPGQFDSGWEVLKVMEKLALVKNLGVPRESHRRADLEQSSAAQ